MGEGATARDGSKRRLAACFIAGCGTYLAWFYVVFLQMFTPLEFRMAPLSALQMLPGVSALVIMIACSLASSRIAPLSSHVKATGAVGALALAGAWGSYAGQMAVSASIGLYVAGAVSFGIGFGWFTLLWAELLRRLDATRGGALWGGSILVASVLCLALRSLTVTVALAASLMLPALTTVFAVLTVIEVNRIVRREGPFFRVEGTLEAFPWKSTALVLVYAFVFGLSGSAFSSDVAELAGQGVAGAVLVACCTALASRVGFSSLYRLVLPCMVVGLLLVPLLGGENMAVQVLVNIGFSLLVASFALYVTGFSSRLEHPSIRSIGLTYSAAFVMVSLGSLCGEVLPSVLPHTPYAVAVAVSAAIILVVATSFWPKRHDPSALFDDPSAKAGLSEPVAEAADVQPTTLEERIRLRCDEVAATYALSAREREVLEFLAQGKSIARTASILYLSHATVKTHVHHIYRKLDVHTRDELRDVLAIA